MSPLTKNIGGGAVAPPAPPVPTPLTGANCFPSPQAESSPPMSILLTWSCGVVKNAGHWHRNGQEKGATMRLLGMGYNGRRPDMV